MSVLIHRTNWKGSEMVYLSWYFDGQENKSSGSLNDHSVIVKISSKYIPELVLH